MNKNLYLIGYASGIAGTNPRSGDAPFVLKNSSILQALQSYGISLNWEAILQPSTNERLDIASIVQQLSLNLSEHIVHLLQQKKFFLVLGGDHTSAIGTWSGVSKSLAASKESLGLIWIDAHMDSHTPQTTESGHLHGMPLACLLGYGDPKFTTLTGLHPALRPENVCLIGVRSYETGEFALLKKLGVRIFFMEEVQQRGLEVVFQEAKQIVSRNTQHYGITLDIDSIDPLDAPGTGVVEPNGISGQTLCETLAPFAGDSRLIGMEIVEFDPSRDQNNKTEKLIAHLISSIALG